LLVSVGIVDATPGAGGSIMIKGTLIAESVRVGTTLADVSLTVRQVRRYDVGDVPAYQPKVWTALEFDAADGDAEALARAFADVMAEPGWYVNFSSATETFVVYHGRVFRYPRGDAEGRAAAQAYGREAGVPESQLDWTD
jgi:hypothetical protein